MHEPRTNKFFIPLDLLVPLVSIIVDAEGIFSRRSGETQYREGLLGDN